MVRSLENDLLIKNINQDIKNKVLGFSCAHIHTRMHSHYLIKLWITQTIVETMKRQMLEATFSLIWITACKDYTYQGIAEMKHVQLSSLFISYVVFLWSRNLYSSSSTISYACMCASTHLSIALSTSFLYLDPLRLRDSNSFHSLSLPWFSALTPQQEIEKRILLCTSPSV